MPSEDQSDLIFQKLTHKLPAFDDVPVATLSDVDKLLIKADVTLYLGQRSAAIICNAIGRILLHGPAVRLSYLESRYRALGSSTYLIAAPKRMAPSGIKPRSLSTGRLMPHYLWICVNGANEAEAAMMRFEIRDQDDNFKRLNKTGILTK